MANAKVTTPEGIVVDVAGTPDEVTAIVDQLRARMASPGPVPSRGSRPKTEKVRIPDLVDDMKTDEFFKTPRGLADIQAKLAELGHHYPITTLSGAMQAEARKRNLRRFKQDGKYVYVQ